jgi:small conductance mechanosensitive channel
MPDPRKPPLSDIIAFFHGDGSVIVQIVIVVLAAFIALRLARIFVHGIVKALLDREATEGTLAELSAVEIKKRMETIETLGVSVLHGFVILIAAIMILGKIGLDIGPAVAGLGIVGIAVGFGAQSLVKDYFTGALILIENWFSKGDVITVAGVSGTVEDFSLRRTTLRDLDGSVHVVPNSEIHVASNLTRVWARINQDVTVAHGTNVDRAIDVVDGVGKEMAEDPLWKRRLLEPPHVERVEAIGEYGVTLKILGTVRAHDRWATGGELRKRLLSAFASNGIEIPRPQRLILAQQPNGVKAIADGPAPTEEELADLAE